MEENKEIKKWVQALYVVYTKKTANAREISKKLGISSDSVYSHMNFLASRGLVKREVNIIPSDTPAWTGKWKRVAWSIPEGKKKSVQYLLTKKYQHEPTNETD